MERRKEEQRGNDRKEIKQTLQLVLPIVPCDKEGTNTHTYAHTHTHTHTHIFSHMLATHTHTVH